MARLTRKSATRGASVTVTFNDGRTPLVGTLIGWGSQLIDVAPADRDGSWPWKRHAVSVTAVTSVTTA